MKVVVISVHDEESVRQMAIEAGADANVPTRVITTDRPPAVRSARRVRRGLREE
jgi:DNA-binding NarL/FixJ family response regulator